jgi:hypothetical protein
VTVTSDRERPGQTAPADLLETAIVANAIAARMVNEAIRDGRLDGGAPASFICECGAVGCRAMVELAPVDYEFVAPARGTSWSCRTRTPATGPSPAPTGMSSSPSMAWLASSRNAPTRA